MQKYLLLFVSIVAGVMIGYLWLQNHKQSEELRKLNNALAASQQLVKETQTAVSSKAFELEDLKAKNTDLQKVIKKNKEEIFAVTNLSIQWKERFFEIKDAKVTAVDESGSQPASLTTECTECFAKTRTRVEFNYEQDDLNIYGFTVTNPTNVWVNIRWLKPINLELILTKTENGSFKIYLDPERKQSNTFVPTELTLKVDPSVFNKKWYEKINFTANLAFGNSLIGTPTQFGGIATIGAGYMLTHNFSLGINVSAVYAGNVYLFYGANLIWFPFARKQ